VALRIFKEVLPEKLFKRSRKALRRLRRAAGGARDWDVFLVEIAERRKRARARVKPGLDFLAGVARSRRMLEQEELIETAEEPNADIAGIIAEVQSQMPEPDKVRADAASESVELAPLARRTLRKLLAELHQAAAENLHDYEHLHQVRIHGKNLRY